MSGTEDEHHIDVRCVGSIPCVSVITSLLSWNGKLFVGSADRSVKVLFQTPTQHNRVITALNQILNHAINSSAGLLYWKVIKMVNMVKHIASEVRYFSLLFH